MVCEFFAFKIHDDLKGIGIFLEGTLFIYLFVTHAGV
jgi:hypothetical protein